MHHAYRLWPNGLLLVAVLLTALYFVVNFFVPISSMALLITQNIDILSVYRYCRRRPHSSHCPTQTHIRLWNLIYPTNSRSRDGCCTRPLTAILERTSSQHQADTWADTSFDTLVVEFRVRDAHVGQYRPILRVFCSPCVVAKYAAFSMRIEQMVFTE